MEFSKVSYEDTTPVRSSPQKMEKTAMSAIFVVYCHFFGGAPLQWSRRYVTIAKVFALKGEFFLLNEAVTLIKSNRRHFQEAKKASFCESLALFSP